MNYAWLSGSVPKQNVDRDKLNGYRTMVDGNELVFSLNCDDATDPYELLDDLINAFGKPLDKVRGLYLYVSYTDIDDGCSRYVLEINDGMCLYRETELVEHPMSECAFRIG